MGGIPPYNPGTWTLLANYTGSWIIPDLPGAATDNAGNIVIAWTDDTQTLNAVTVQSPFTSGPIPPPKPFLAAGSAVNSPSVAYMADTSSTFMIFYVSPPTAASPGLTTIPFWVASPRGGFPAYMDYQAADGPQVVQVGGIIYCGWRGPAGDELLYFTDVGTPYGSESATTLTSQFSPAVAADTNAAYLYTVFLGIDQNLYVTSTPIGANTQPFANAGSPTPAQPITVAGNDLMGQDRPSLAVFNTPANGDTLIAVYFNNGQLYWTTTPCSNGNVPLDWGNTFPINTYFANPRAVLVSNPTLSTPPYLLVGNRGTDSNIESVLSLYQFTPSPSST